MSVAAWMLRVVPTTEFGLPSHQSHVTDAAPMSMRAVVAADAAAVLDEIDDRLSLAAGEVLRAGGVAEEDDVVLREVGRREDRRVVLGAVAAVAVAVLPVDREAGVFERVS